MEEGFSTTDPPVGYILRDIFTKEGSLEEARTYLDDYKTRDGWLFMLGSNEEMDGVLYEIAGGEMNVSPMEDYYLISNFFP